MRHAAVLLSLAFILVLPSRSAAQPSAAERMLFAGPTGPQLRWRLMTHADTIAAKDPSEAARALGFCGQSFARDGAQDSSIAAFQRAYELDSYRRYELADALLLRQKNGDAQQAIEILRPVQPDNLNLPGPSYQDVQGLMAWAQFLAGRPDSSARLFKPVQHWLSAHQEWRYRMACLAIEQHEWSKVVTLLTPLSLASRMLDVDVMGMMSEAGDQMGGKKYLFPQLRGNLATRDGIEAECLAELGARRVMFTGRSGTMLGAVLFTPKPAPHARSVVILGAPDDTVAAYDSLAIAMRNIGLAVLLFDMRGSGLSVYEGCPLPGSWRGREVEMQTLCAQDVRYALRALGRETKADTSEYLIVGVGPTAPIAVEAAQLDARAKAVLLVGCAPQPVDRGRMRATLAAIRRPVYFQTGPDEFTSWTVIDSLYRACDMRASRVADSERSGMRARIFRRDPKIFERFRLWLADAWPVRRKPASPPSKPKQG